MSLFRTIRCTQPRSVPHGPAATRRPATRSAGLLGAVALLLAAPCSGWAQQGNPGVYGGEPLGQPLAALHTQPVGQPLDALAPDPQQAGPAVPDGAVIAPNSSTPLGIGAAASAGDPPSRVVRLSILNGNVSTEGAGVNTFTAAEVNQVLTSGDRVYTDPNATAELQAGQIALQLGGGTDLTVTAMTDALAQFGVAAGAAHLRTYALQAGAVVELDSPEAAVTVLQPGDVRVDVDPSAHTTTITLTSGQVQVDSPTSSQVLTPGQRIRIHAGDPASGENASVEPLAAASPDALDSFSDDRSSLYASGTDAASPYMNPDTTGAADLAAYGAWHSSDYAPVWYPVVAAGWQPYRFGRWCWIAPWGWTWVGTEPWGFAPFHYGRWVALNNRWGWIPGSPAVRPVYAPALVAFAGGGQFAASLGYAPAVGIAAWFPLGPREPYVPPYRGSTLYRNRINASNLYDPNAAQVRGFYNQRAVDVFTATPLAGRSFANRLAGTVAVPQTSFVSGRSVARATLRLSPEELASAPVLSHLPAAPESSLIASRTPVALPPVLARPTLAGRSLSDGSAGDAETAGAILFHRAEPPSQRSGSEPQRPSPDGTVPVRLYPSGQLGPSHDGRPAGVAAPREASHPAPVHSASPPPVSAPSAVTPHK